MDPLGWRTAAQAAPRDPGAYDATGVPTSRFQSSARGHGTSVAPRDHRSGRTRSRARPRRAIWGICKWCMGGRYPARPRCGPAAGSATFLLSAPCEPARGEFFRRSLIPRLCGVRSSHSRSSVGSSALSTRVDGIPLSPGKTSSGTFWIGAAVQYPCPAVGSSSSPLLDFHYCVPYSIYCVSHSNKEAP